MVALFACVLLTRIFLLDAGFGTGEDARQIAEATRQWHETGRYQMARAPGSLPYEFLCSVISRGVAWVLNLVSALACAAAAVVFAQLARRGGSAVPALSALVMTMVPEPFLFSISTSPQWPALALGLGALLAAAGGRALSTGLLLGLAAATRLSAVIYFLPAAILLLGCRRFAIQRNGLHLGIATVVALATAAACFLPAWQVQGAQLLDSVRLPPSARPDYPADLAMILRGPTGAALAVAAAGMLTRFILLRNVPSGRRPRLDPFVVAALAILLAEALAIFAAFPRETLYPLAAVPALAFFIAAWTNRRFLWLVALLVMLAPWVGWEGFRPVRGPVLLDREKRFQELDRDVSP